MQEPAPKGINVIEHTDSHTENLQVGVAESTGQIVGRPVGVAEVNPSHDATLDQIADVVRKTVGHSVDMAGDRGLSTSSRDETAAGNKGVSLLREKLKGMLHRK